MIWKKACLVKLSVVWEKFTFTVLTRIFINYSQKTFFVELNRSYFSHISLKAFTFFFVVESLWILIKRKKNLAQAILGSALARLKLCWNEFVCFTIYLDSCHHCLPLEQPGYPECTLVLGNKPLELSSSSLWLELIHFWAWNLATVCVTTSFFM